ncbi:MAG: XRE family transcriptional regulator [Lactobacillus sp.]|nr:XRE family transcriptional regulator [Lactobacillus sp.]
MDFFYYQDLIARNLIYYIRKNGYTKSSIARLTCIPQNDLEELLTAKVSDPRYYNEQIIKITNSLNLVEDYFLRQPNGKMSKWLLQEQSVPSERSELAQELLNDLDELISVCQFYIKN